MTPDEYRKKHKRCATCEYFSVEKIYYGIYVTQYDYNKYCEVKNKETDKNRGRFCRVYKAREFAQQNETVKKKVAPPVCKPTR